MTKEHTDEHTSHKDPKWRYHHTFVPEPWTMVHLGGPGKVPWPDDEGKTRFAYPGFTVFTMQNVSMLANERMLFHARQNATLRSSHSVTLLGHDHVNALSNRATNIGSQGAVVLASISKHTPEAVSGRVPGETLVGDRAPVEEDHPKFVESRNKFFNTLVNASNTAKALNGTVSLVKTMLGFTNGIGDTSIAALNTVVSTFNTFLSTTAAYVSASKGAGTTNESFDETPATGDSSGGANSGAPPSPHESVGNETSGSATPATTPATDYSAELKATLKYTTTVTKDGLPLTGAILKDVTKRTAPYSDAEVLKNKQLTSMSEAEIVEAKAQQERAFPTGVYAEGDGETHSRETGSESWQRNETDDETRARLKADETKRQAKFDRRVDRVTSGISNTLTTSQNFMGIATGIADVKAALDAKPKPIGGLAALSDTSVLIGAEKDITMIARGGVNVVVPAFFSGVSVLSGGGVSINTLFSSSVFALQGVTIEGGLTAGLTAGGTVQVGSRRKEISVMGKQVKIGARAKTVGQMSSALRQDGKRSWNPQKQLATQSVAIETDVAGTISLVVPTEKTDKSASSALVADMSKESQVSSSVAAVGVVGAITAASFALNNNPNAAVVGAGIGAAIGIADSLARLGDVAKTETPPPEKQRVVLTKDDLVLQHHEAKITLKHDSGIVISYGSGEKPDAEIQITKDGVISLKGKKLLMDFDTELVMQKGSSPVLKLDSSGASVDGQMIKVNGSNLTVIK